MERLSITKFERFQVEVMGNYNRARKCRICPNGYDHGPAYRDDECHKCAIEREENISDGG
jgi:hypothetical protein